MKNYKLIEFKCDNCNTSYFTKNCVKKIRCKKCNTLIQHKMILVNKTCVVCKKIFQTSKYSKQKSCSRICRDKLVAQLRIKNRKKKKCLQCNKEFEIIDKKRKIESKFCCRQCYYEYYKTHPKFIMSQETKNRLSQIAKKQYRNGRKVHLFDNKKPNKLEKFLFNILDNLNIEYVFNHKIFVNSHFFEFTRVDAFIYPNICIYVDGDYWHCNPKKYSADYYNQRRNMISQKIWDYDNEITNILENKNYIVFRIWEMDLKENKEKYIKLFDKTIPRQPAKAESP